MFDEIRTRVHNEEGCGRPSLIAEDLKSKIDQNMRTVLMTFVRHLFQFLGVG
jgi:hypothetical protein